MDGKAAEPEARGGGARCLDLTRLISRQGRGPLTGIDRVELAYLTQLLDAGGALFVLIRTRLGYLLLDRSGAERLADRLTGRSDWGRGDLLGLLSRGAQPQRRRAEADCRRLAIGRSRRGALGRLLRRAMPAGCTYVNVGHSDLGREVLSAWKSVPGARVAVMIHDMIPLDFPQFQRPGMAGVFEEKMRRVARFADVILCNSRRTEADVMRWFAHWGHSAKTAVAHLGVWLPRPDPAALPPEPDLSRPTFVVLGTIEPRKNHALLLDIWEEFAATLSEQSIPQLVIAGARGWNNAELFHRLDTSPLMERHVFERSGLPDVAIAALIGRAAGVLFPSLAEGYGLPAAEALMLGTPVICSKLPVFEEILGNIPVYAESSDVYLWKQSILQLAERKRAGDTGGGSESEDFECPTWADHFNLVLKVI